MLTNGLPNHIENNNVQTDIDGDVGDDDDDGGDENSETKTIRISRKNVRIEISNGHTACQVKSKRK